MSTALARYIETAREAGCPRDQVESFLRAGAILQPKQLLFAAAARECDKPGGPVEVGFGGARGGGKSHVTFVQVAIDDCQRVPGLKVLFLRKVGRSGKESFEDLRLRTLNALPHKTTSYGLIFPNGSRIYIGHFQNESDVDKYLGLEYDVIVIEEHTTLSTSKVKAIATVNRSSKPDFRPRIYATTNPGGIGHAGFKKRFIMPWRKGEEADTRFIPSTVYDNRLINPEYRATLERLTGWQRDAWLHGDWDALGGTFFTNWHYETHVISPEKIAVPRGFDWGLSLDYGVAHLTVAHLWAYGKNRYYCVDEYAARRKLVEQNAAGIHDMLARHEVDPDKLRFRVAGADLFSRRESRDRKGNSVFRTIADDYKECGLIFRSAVTDRIAGAGAIFRLLGDPKISEEEIAGGVPEVDPQLYFFDRCSRIIEQIPAMEHDPKRGEDVLKVDVDEDGDGGDDAYDSGRYGVMAMVAGRKWTHRLDELRKIA